MRRRLILQAAAVTSMVTLAFVVPLAILIGDVAADRSMARAEREAENIARYMALTAPELPTETALNAFIPTASSPYDISIVGPDGSVVGSPIPASENLSSATTGSGSRTPVDGGRAIYIPVIGADGATSVIRVFVPDSELRIGVSRSWLTLGGLSITLVLIAVLIADWIGRTIVKPVAQLSETAARLGAGDLTARVEPDGPEEVKAVGHEFNRLAGQIDRLLLLEREAAADLSHRLRTPLTASATGCRGSGTRRYPRTVARRPRCTGTDGGLRDRPGTARLDRWAAGCPNRFCGNRAGTNRILERPRRRSRSAAELQPHRRSGNGRPRSRRRVRHARRPTRQRLRPHARGLTNRGDVVDKVRRHHRRH